RSASAMTKGICPFSEASFLNFGFMILQLPHHVAEYCTSTTSLSFTMSERLSFSNSCSIIILLFIGVAPVQWGATTITSVLLLSSAKLGWPGSWLRRRGWHAWHLCLLPN